MGIILCCFILINFFIILLGLSFGMPKDNTIAYYKAVYYFLFSRGITIIKRGIFHPVSFVIFIISGFLKVGLGILYWISFLILDHIIYLILSGVVFYFIFNNIYGPIVLKSCFGIILVIVLYIILFGTFFLPTIRNKIYLSVCFLKQLNDNIFFYHYEKLLNNAHKKRKSPKEYYYEKKKEQEEQLKRLKAELRSQKKHQEKNTNNTSTHRKTYLDLLYAQELQILELYMTDFTIDDLNKKRKELLKTHHPDNFHSEQEIQKHQQIYNEIQKAYTIIKRELKK